MANGSSLKDGAIGFAFDLDSQKGVTHLLASIRASEINSEQKNELRDLVFLYTNGGKDQSVRLTLEQKVLTYNVVPLAITGPIVEEIAQPKPQLPFGTYRPAPSFFTAINTVKEPVPTIVSSTPNISVPTSFVAPTPTPVPEQVVSSIQTPSPVPTPELVTEAPVVQSEQVTLSPVSPLSQPEVRQEVPIQASPTVSENLDIPPVSYDSEQALQRIREIKSLVNDKVGNPVNLVDINNEVGREYMGALLDAMKKLNSGTSVISAMKRLETAFQLVEKTIEEYNQQKIKTEAELKSSRPVVETPPEIQVTTEPVVTPDRPVSPVSTFQPIAKPVEDNVEVKVQTLSSVEEVKSSQPELVTQVKTKEALPESDVATAWGKETDTVLTHNKPTTENFVASKAVPLAETKIKLKTPNDLPLASSLDTSTVSGDPLFTKEVDDGLNQLLQEWSLFKKSGLFGTGPNGREHPLFKTMAVLQIPLLLAGRFEDATQEIKQSITDYMNGWRYEQGIIYEQGETFEHYLRRVIRHILDLQKK